MTGNFYVDGRRVTISYSKKPLSTMNTEACANAASVALAAAQWTNHDTNYNNSKNMFSDSVLKEKQMESVQNLNSGSRGEFQNIPDVTTYQYDENSGYYYDSSTGYYYDPNSQYYYNSETRQYLYWDIEKQTYMSVPSNENYTTSAPAIIHAPAVKTEKTTEVVISSPPVIAHAPVLTLKKETEDKTKKVNSHDKVKIAKRVVKDMEKWAKTLNQKKENFKQALNANVIKSYEEPSIIMDVNSFSEKKQLDTESVASTMFEKDISNGNLILLNESKEKSSTTLVAAYGGESDSEMESELLDEGSKAQEIMKIEEAKLIDNDKMACLLCKRQFASKEVLTKHVQFSDLHKQNIDMLKLTKLTPRQLQELEKKETGYRDRAKERRQKFGQPDAPPPSRLKARYIKERKEAFMPPDPPVEAIGSENIGNKMLKAMGWTEGQGLGKSGQGMSGIIEVQRRVKSAGLGMKGAAYGANASDSYKDAVRKSMQQRYNDIA